MLTFFARFSALAGGWLAVLLMTSCGLVSPEDRAGKASGTTQALNAQTSAWSLASMLQTGFVADSSVTAVIDRGEGPVEIVDKASMNLIDRATFGFSRTRTHSGASDGVSVETTATIRSGKDWFTRGSSGQWVRWDDAMTQPDRVIEEFIAAEDALLQVVSECGMLGQPDEKGRRPITGLNDSCRYMSKSTGKSRGRWAGRVKALAGYIRLKGNMPVGAAVELDCVSGFEPVAASVKLKYVLTVGLGGDRDALNVPDEYLDSRRPRPVRMVESVLSGLVDEWGPGAPGVLRKSQSGGSAAR